MEQKVANYLYRYHPLAVAEQQRTGIPAAIKLAQAILESGVGEGDLAQRSNNHFGIKCKSNWTGPTVLHDDDARNECFRAYDAVEHSFRDHSDFLKANPRYARLFELDVTDYRGWAYGLKAAGYATNPAYPQRLIRVIETYGLANYTQLAQQGLAGTYDWVSRNITPTAGTVDEPPIPESVLEPLPVSSPGGTMPANPTASYPEGFFDINGLKVKFVKAGTPLLPLAHQQNLSVGDLIRYNDMPQTAVLKQDQLLFFEKKKRRGIAATYTLKQDLRIWEISQLTGIQLRELMRINGVYNDQEVLPEGAVIRTQ